LYRLALSVGSLVWEQIPVVVQFEITKELGGTLRETPLG
jgi:hypothetical protein